MSKKTISFFLSLIIVSGSVCVMSKAVNSVTVSSASEFIKTVENAENGSVIYLKGGIYRFSEPLLFKGVKKNITVSSVLGETATFTNACPVTQWEECTVNGVKAFCTSAKGKNVSAQNYKKHYKRTFG